MSSQHGNEHENGGAAAPVGDIQDNGDSFSVAGVRGRIFKSVGGHTLTEDEVRTLLVGGTITITDGKRKDGTPFRSAPTARWDADAQPYPKIVLEFDDSRAAAAPGGPTGVPAKGADGEAEIVDEGGFYTVAAFKNERGWPVRFYKTVAGREISPEELAQILESGETGVFLEGFTSKRTGRTFSARLRYNPKKEPYPGLELVFDR